MFYLFVWTIIASGNSYSHNTYQPHHDWKNQGEFISYKTCQEAGTSLGYASDKFRCIRK